MERGNIQALYPKIRKYLATQPVDKAWIFGSCARGQNTEDSDIDILVRYSSGQIISLMKISKIMCDLSRIVGMRVDLVEEDRLLPFAMESVNRDKKLIYERTN